MSSKLIRFNSNLNFPKLLKEPGSVRVACRRLPGLVVAVGIAFLTAASLCAAPIYMLRYSVTNANLSSSLQGYGVSTGAGIGVGGKAIAGVNDAGDVCGTFYENSTPYAGGTNSVFLLRPDGTVYNLFPGNVTPAATSAAANYISNRRQDGSVQIAGWVTQTNGFQRGAIWTVDANGAYSVIVLTNLVLPTNSLAPGEQHAGEANAINSSGFIVGDGNSSGATVGLNWVRPYGAPNDWWWGDYNTAVAVNDQGTALANGDFGLNGTLNASLINGASQTDLPQPVVNSSYVAGYAMAGSRVVGEAVFDNSGAGLPFEWKVGDGTLTQLPAPNGVPYTSYTDSIGVSVNTNGDIVGTVNNNQYTLWKNESGTYHAYLLDRLLVAQPGFSPVGGGANGYSIAINNHSDIALISDGNSNGSLYNDYSNVYNRVLVYQPVTDGVVQFTTNQTAVVTNSMIGCFVERTNASVQVPVELIRADGYSNSVTVHYATADGGALAGTDYVAQSGTLTWNSNQSGVRYVSIQLKHDFSYWPSNKTFYVNLSGISGAEAGIANAEAIIISHDDQEAVMFTNQDVQAGYWGYNVRAGASNVVVTLARSGPLDGTMQISGFTISDGSAYNGVDYESVNPTPITWNPGQGGSVSISIPLLDTTNLTTAKYFWLDADGYVDGQKYVYASTSTVNILPLDQTPPFQFNTSTPLVQSNAFNLISEIEQGVTVLLQSSTNLVDWQTIGQVHCTNGVIQFNPSIQPKEPGLFYRAVVQ